MQSRQLCFNKLLLDKKGMKYRSSKVLRILNWNIQNSSLSRAKAQANWIVNENCNVIILTEVKLSKGGYYISDYLQSSGYDTIFPDNGGNDYRVMLAIKGHEFKCYNNPIDFLPHRFPTIILNTGNTEYFISGVYVPSRGPKERRNVDKRRFQDVVSKSLKHLSVKYDMPMIIGGDLNVIERNHIPSYSIFGEWEYLFYESFDKIGMIDAYRYYNKDTHEHSWLGKSGNGYRFDHIFISQKVQNRITKCVYLHDCRENSLSDHSGMLMEINI